MKKTTIIVAGDLWIDTYSFCCRFYADELKIFSTFVGNEKKLNWKFEPNIHSNKDIFLSNKKPKNCFRKKERMDEFLFVVATLRALENVESEYVIVMRGNEWYSNLKIIESFLDIDSKKIYSTEALFKKNNDKIHVGNLLAGSTDNINIIFEECLLCMCNETTYSDPLPVLMGSCHHGDFEVLELDQFRYYKVSSEDKVWYSNFDAKKENCLRKFHEL